MVSVHPVKRLVSMVLVFAILLSMFLGTGSLFATKVQAATGRQMESLDRGLVAVKTGDGVFLSWRLLGTESYDTAFNVYRNGSLIASNITASTNYLDTGGSSSASYYVRSVVGGNEATQSDTVTPWAQNYMDVPLQKPANTTLNGTAVTYSANDATVADVDGDGAYEIILKWDPSNSQDNSKSGYTSNVYVDCYEMNGTLRWRIDLGKNIRAGAHYTQIIAYDLNGDGKAEVAMKTADGTVDGQGNVIGDKDADYRNSSGYILSGPEYLTLFEGKTGKELVTIDYNPPRGTVSSWGDSYGNRVDRFLAGVAYFDGKTPSLVVCRGYYTRCVIVSYEYKGGTLNQEWVFDSNTSGNGDYAGEGNHNLSIADVDNDGFDEIVYGSAVIDHNGKGLYATGNGHGDALHVSDFDPDRAGLEVYQVHEETGSSIESIQFRDAATGKTIWSKKLSKDIGRGLILNIDPDFYPYVTLASNSNFYTKGGASVTSSISGLGINFASYWDGDLYREGLDGTTIRKWDYNNDKVVTVLSGSNVHSNNSTKSTPSLSGDILGDWREEVIWPTSDDTALRIYTTTDVTDAKLYTLMHDSQYRCAIAWQNVAYNQPPHTSYFIGPTMAKPTQPSIYTVGTYTLATPDSTSGEAHTHSYTSSVSLAATCENDGVRSYICACGASYSEAIPALGHSYQNDICANCGQLDPNSETAQASGYIHNFTSDQLVSSFYTISGNLSAKGTVSYGGMSLTRCLKMESATSVTFSPTRSGKLMLVFHKTGYNVDAVGQTVMLDGTAYTVLDGGDYAYVELPISAGAHELKRGSGQIFLYYMAFTPNASGESHTHSYSSSVTTAATCTSAGVRTYSCSCGNSYTEAIAALGHSYSGGSCTRCGAADPNSGAEEYLARDAFFSMEDSSINRMSSEHFQIIWGNADESGQVNEAFVRGNLTNLENIWDFYVNVLGMKEPNTSMTSGSSQKYKTNFYISNTGLGNVVMDDWAYMSVDSGGFGYMCLMPGAMRVDEPSWVLPHELAHVFTYHQGGNEPYGYYEAIANWFRDQYLGSTYYAYGGNVYGPTSDFFKPYLVNHDYYFPHIYNWYDAWPILLYISENPDNINGLGMDLIHDILENKANGSTIFAIIDELSDVSVKDILGYMTRRMVTLDFSRQEYYQLRRSEQMTAAEIAGMYTTLESKSDGYLHSPASEAPMQGGFNIIALDADLSKSSLNVEFAGTSTASGADYRASIVTVTRSGDTRYSSLFSSGIGSIALQGDEIAAYVVVCATPDTMEALTTYEETAVGTRYTYKLRVVEDAAHTHSYTSSVTTAASCTTAGVRTYQCACGNSYTETIAALGHNYVNGTCTRCGAADPSYNPGGDVVVPAGSYVHNFTENGKNSDFYTISGNTSTSKGSVTYDGKTLTTCLKIESSTNIAFTAPKAGKLTLVFGGSTSASGKAIKIDGTSHDIDSTQVLTVNVAAGSHTITKDDSIFLFYMVYAPESTGGDVHTHSYTASVTTAATCESAGVKTYTCSCGDSYTEAIPALGHSYSSVVTAPTCTANGYTTYTCSTCGNSYTSNQTSATGHSYSNGSCTVCGAADPDYVTEWEDTWTTEYTDWITLNADGTVTFTISGTVAAGNWGFIDNVRLWNGDYEEIVLTNGYFEDGTNGWNLTGLNYVYADETAKNNKTNRLALWLSNESDVYGSASNTVSVPAGNYYFTYDIIGNAGLTVSVSKTENHTHSYSSSVTTAATCTTAGVRTYTCTCGDSYTESIPALGHSYSSKVTAPTCTAQGYTTYTCSTCGDSYTGNQTAATGHSYSSSVTKVPDCTNTGVRTYTCSACGDSYTEAIAALGHTEETVAGKAATCTEKGLTEGKKCSVCGEVLVAQTEIAATGHSFANGVCTVCGAADPDYVAGVTISGNYVSYGNASDVLTIQLIAEGESEAAYVFTNEAAPANTGSWSIEGVAQGKYTVQVMKQNHVTREYELTVTDGVAAVDVQICLLGDVDANGKVNYTDYINVLTQSKNPAEVILTGYARQCADITGEGNISYIDYLAILSHAKGITSLW